MGDQFGICPWTDFGKTVLYQTYDIPVDRINIKIGSKQYLQLFLGNGMWRHPGGLQTGAPAPVLRFLLTMTFDDGTKQVVRSGDASWIATPGPYVANDPWSRTTTDCSLFLNKLPEKRYFVPALKAVDTPPPTPRRCALS